MLLIVLACIAVVAGLAWFFMGRKVSQPSSPTAGGRSKSSVAKRVLVCFGTQTGTATSFAKTIVREGNRQGLNCLLEDLEEINPSSLTDEDMIIFVVSTYGEGEPTDPCKQFFEWLASSERSDDFANVRYALFGLGDRQYPLFCAAGEYVDKRVEELGGKRIFGMGYGDAGRTIEQDFDTWRQELWPVIAHELGVHLIAIDENMTPELTMKPVDQTSPRPFPQALTTIEPTQKQPWFAKISGCQPIVVDGERKVIRVTLDVTGSAIAYQAGDHLGILPMNSDDTVQEYLSILGVGSAEATQPIGMFDAKGRNVFPMRVSPVEALRWYLDLSGIPKKATLRAFAQYCSDERERDEFNRMLRVDGQSAFSSTLSSCRTVFGFLKKFSSCRVPLAHFLEAMPRLQPRFYSIASDQLATATEVTILVAVEPQGVVGNMFLRFCSVAEGLPAIPLFIRKSKFHLPLKEKSRSLLMIGPGTGVAPFVGFCRRRSEWAARGHTLGSAILFFGCRSPSDFLEEKYLRECDEKSIIKLDVAFSRTGPNKVYVQHRMKERAGDVWSVIQDGGNIYVCGDAKHMARDVDDMLHQIAQSEGKMSHDAAVAFFKKLHDSGRFHKDVW